MTPTDPIARRPLREDVRKRVLHLILSGTFAPGSRVKELDLSERLGVSRTPIREALLGLEQEGFVRADLARGFSILPLTREEASQLYPVVWTLESLALETSDPDAVPYDRLAQLGEAMKKDTGAARLKDVDRRWHRALLSGCDNTRLLELIDNVKLRTQRYEIAYMNDGGRVRHSRDQHARVASALRARETKRAARLLREHWVFGMEAVLEWLENSGARLAQGRPG